MPGKETGVEGGWIGVISDTHIPRRAYCLPPKIFELLEGASLIVHAGDLVEDKVLTELEALAPVTAVAGNMDPPELQNRLGKEKFINYQEKKIALVHGIGRGEAVKEWAIRNYHPGKVDGVIFGHIHKPVYEFQGGLMLFCPGSPTDPRAGTSPSVGRLWYDGEGLKAEIIYL